MRGAARRPAEGDGPTLRFPIALGEGERFAATAFGIPLAFSPDDRRVAYASFQRDTFRLLLRALDELAARPVPAAEGLPLNPAISLSPAFSPDGRWIALALADRIVRVPIEGGSPVPITTLPGGGVAGMRWLSTDTLLASVGGRLVAIPAQGGAWRPLSTPDSARDEVAQWGPALLPDGARVAYVSVSRDGIPSHRVATVPLAGGRQTITGYRGVGVLGTAHGHLLFVTAGGGVSAVPMDALTERASTEPVPVLDGVLVRPGGAMKAALSDRGSLVYQRGESAVQLTLVDARGAGTPLASEGRVFVHPRLSPDGRRVAVEVRAARGTDVWLYTRADRTLTRLTTDGDADGNNDLPEWSPDGTRIVYRATGRGGTTLRWVRADGSGVGGVLVGADGAPYDAVFTPDGRTLVYRTQDRRSIIAVPLDGAGAPAGPRRPIVSSAFLNAAPRVSPDGRWLAYISDETGRPEVYVRAFPGPGPRAQVSAGGGGEPLWSRDGGAVYYRNGRALLAARLTTAPSLGVAGRDTLFTGAYLGDASHANYDVAPDDSGFLMLQIAADESETLVVHGWAHELRARLGGRR